MGRKSEGIYADKSKAIYWDGKNDSGEEVASGIYYYSITAGDFSATLILECPSRAANPPTHYTTASLPASAPAINS